MPPRALRTPLSLVVLGLLGEQPQHPYRMRALMHERGHDRIVKRGGASLYDAVARLTAAALVEVQESVQDSRRPGRTVYRITAQGLSALQGWVREALADPELSDQFTAALSFMYVLPPTEVVALLSQRMTALDALVNTSHDALGDALDAGVPPIFLSEERYNQAQLRAQHDWLDGFTTQLRDGQLSWPQPNPDHGEQP